MSIYETLAELETPAVTWKDQLPFGIRDFTLEAYKNELVALEYSSLFILPLTVEGEEERKRLYNDCLIGRYGSSEKNIIYNNESYLTIIVGGH